MEIFIDERNEKKQNNNNTAAISVRMVLFCACFPFYYGSTRFRLNTYAVSRPENVILFF